MTDNVVKTTDGIEIYTHSIFCFADEFIRIELSGELDLVHDHFLQMILYISDRIKKPSHDDISLLDAIFDVYVRLCVKYRVLPTLEVFSMLVKINKSTFSDWKNGEYRKSSDHSKTVKRWFEICKNLVIDKLHNSEKTDVNLIFISKAAYGLVETVSTLIKEDSSGLPLETPQQIIERWNRQQQLPPPMPDFD